MSPVSLHTALDKVAMFNKLLKSQSKMVTQVSLVVVNSTEVIIPLLLETQVNTPHPHIFKALLK